MEDEIEIFKWLKIYLVECALCLGHVPWNFDVHMGIRSHEDLHGDSVCVTFCFVIFVCFFLKTTFWIWKLNSCSMGLFLLAVNHEQLAPMVRQLIHLYRIPTGGRPPLLVANRENNALLLHLISISTHHLAEFFTSLKTLYSFNLFSTLNCIS